MNTLTITGKLFKDAEVQAVGDQSVIKFTILNKDRRKKNKETGKNDYVAIFINCEYWTKFPQKQIQQLIKDSWVLVSGQLQQDSGTDGKTYYKLNIPTFNYPEMVVNPFENVQSSSTPPVPTPSFDNPPVQNAGTFKPEPIVSTGDFDSDIPF